MVQRGGDLQISLSPLGASHIQQLARVLVLYIFCIWENVVCASDVVCVWLSAHLETNNGWFVNTQLDVCFRCFMVLFGVGNVKSRFTLSPNTQSGSVLESSGTLIVPSAALAAMVNNLAESIRQTPNKRLFGCAPFPGNRLLALRAILHSLGNFGAESSLLEHLLGWLLWCAETHKFFTR